jgi:hypothetical protein
MGAQERANANSYNDGRRCAAKGLGLTKRGHYDWNAWGRLFERGYRAWHGVDKEEARAYWSDGFVDELYRKKAFNNGHLECGRPI